MSRLVTCISALRDFPQSPTTQPTSSRRNCATTRTAELAKVPGKDGKFSTALPDYLREQIKLANQRDRDAWNRVKTKEDWEKFRDERIKALRESLGTWPEVPKNMPDPRDQNDPGERLSHRQSLIRIAAGRVGRWEFVLSRYAAAEMPVILIAHSHHAPKHQGELQDMGVTWAKLGCIVLVIDQLGHGERRQHPFNTAKDYPKPFRVSRQDYYFRYNLNLQLSLVGDSLMGWMAWDLMRGLDVALARTGADKDRVILLGSVAAGGDVAAVTAALDPRFKCVVPFNFGGPQPETRYPLPEDAETWFNYAGSGSWESTRNLRDSAAKGFLPWVIVASVAPRMVIHAHEFSWDRERDPVWKRYQKVWGFYNATDQSLIHNRHRHDPHQQRGSQPLHQHRPDPAQGHLRGPEEMVRHPDSGEGIEGAADEGRADIAGRAEARSELKPRPLNEVLAVMADGQWRQRQRELEKLSVADARNAFLDDVRLLWHEPGFLGKLTLRYTSEKVSEKFQVRMIRWRKDARAPRVLELRSASIGMDNTAPVVVCTCQAGPHKFLHERAEAIAAVLRSGACVLMPEWAGTGAAPPGDGRGRASSSASLAATGLMVGYPVWVFSSRNLSWFLDTLTLYPRHYDSDRIVVWGESLAPPAIDPVERPYDLPEPGLAEPLSAWIACLPPVRFQSRAILARGGLVSYRSVLDSPFVHVPHDALPINVFRAGDLPNVWAALAAQAAAPGRTRRWRQSPGNRQEAANGASSRFSMLIRRADWW